MKRMEKVSPTRMNLLSRKSQLGLAREGIELLKQKREVLLAQYMELVKELMAKQRAVHTQLVQAYHCLNTARSIDGWGDLTTAAQFRETSLTVDIRTVSQRGVDIPKIDDISGIGPQFREPFSHSISLRIFEARDRFEKIIKLILEVAPAEASLKRLGREIQKTNRRINALEILLIPRLISEIKHIRNTLEEREREDNFRLRRIKNKKEKAAR